MRRQSDTLHAKGWVLQLHRRKFHSWLLYYQLCKYKYRYFIANAALCPENFLYSISFKKEKNTISNLLLIWMVWYKKWVNKTKQNINIFYWLIVKYSIYNLTNDSYLLNLSLSLVLFCKHFNVAVLYHHCIQPLFL